MEREFNRTNLQGVYRMLFEIAKGNLAFQIERTNHRDELEGLIALLNMTAQKLNKNRNQFLWSNRQNKIVVIRTFIFLLNDKQKIIDCHSEGENFENTTTSKNILCKPFIKLLSKESRSEWNEKYQELLKQKQGFVSLELIYKYFEFLHHKSHSVITRIPFKDDTKFVVTSSLLDLKKDDIFNLPENESVNKLSIWDQQLFQGLQEYVVNHLQEPLKPIYELAILFNTNEQKIKTGFKKIFGMTPFQYHREQRIEQSKILIENTDLSLKEIALKMGFLSYPQFSRSFKSYTEMTPRFFKKLSRN